jgi:hypothetical protein
MNGDGRDRRWWAKQPGRSPRYTIQVLFIKLRRPPFSVLHRLPSCTFAPNALIFALTKWTYRPGVSCVLGLSSVGLMLSILSFSFWQKCKKQPQPAYLYVYLSTLVVPWVYGLIVEVYIHSFKHYTRLTRLRSTFAVGPSTQKGMCGETSVGPL